ncbi:MAG: chromate resistance protein ChrB domain-containing protein [Desulfomonile sp.]|jgi:hypothetical protein
MKWITRENAKVDRVACPWIIKRFVDQEAEFIFVPKDRVLYESEQKGAIPFDVAGVELGHVDGCCSFESIVLRYGLTDDPALVEMAKIVHSADVSADITTSPQGAGLKAIAQGFALLHEADDHKKIELETPMYDALYAWCQTQVENA